MKSRTFKDWAFVKIEQEQEYRKDLYGAVYYLVSLSERKDFEGISKLTLSDLKRIDPWKCKPLLDYLTKWRRKEVELEGMTRNIVVHGFARHHPLFVKVKSASGVRSAYEGFTAWGLYLFLRQNKDRDWAQALRPSSERKPTVRDEIIRLDAKIDAVMEAVNLAMQGAHLRLEELRRGL